MQKKMSNWFYAILSLPATAMGFALSVQISALSWILSTKYGLNIEDIGLVWAAGPIAGIIAQPIVGALSDNMWFMGGRRRPWIIIGGILSGLMMLALPNLEVVQKIFVGGEDPQAGLLSIAVIVALTFDLSINVSFNPTRSLIADCTSMENRAKGYTWMQTISGSFGVLAYFIGGVLGNIALIYIGIGIALLATIIPAFLIEEPRELQQVVTDDAKKSKASARDFIESLLPLIGLLVYGIYIICEKLIGFNITYGIEIFGFFINIVECICLALIVLSAFIVLPNLLGSNKNSNEFQKVLFAHSFTWIGVQTMFVYAFFYLRESMGLDEKMAGSVNSIAFFILSLVSAILPILVLNGSAKRFGMVRTHTICILIMALGYFGIYLFGTSSVISYYALMAIAGIGWASVVSLPFAIMSEKVDQTKMGLYMGIFNLSVVLPQLVASFKMGQIINATADKTIIFAICAACLFISGIFWFTVKESKK